MKGKWSKSVIIFILSIFLISSSTFCQSKKRVAIIAFKNLSGDVSLDYIGSGFGETLTTKLSKVKELDLIERMQILKIFEEQKLQLSGFVEPENAVSIGKILGVQYTIIGSFQKAGNKLKADTRLVNVETGKIDAADDVKGDYDNIFDLQDELALKLANSLNAPVSKEEKIEIAKKPTENLSAYEWYSKGMSYYEKSQYDEALNSFEKATEIDKNFADAFSKAGDIYFYKKGEDGKAIESHTEALKIYEKKQEWEKASLACLRNILAYEEKAKKIGVYDHDTAINVLNLYEKRINFEKKIGDEDAIPGTLINMSYIYDEVLGDTKKAIQKVEEAIKIYEKIKNEAGLKRAKERLEKLKAKTR